MPPESQTLFSIALFLALSSLLAWSNRRNRNFRTQAGAVALVCGEESVEAV